MSPTRLLAAAAATVVAALAPAAAHAATPVQFGTGQHPDVAVDPSGGAHVVWDADSGDANVPDTLHYCRLLGGAKGCTGEIVLHPPLEAIGRSSYVFAPSAGRVVIASYRCCGTGEGVWAYESTDGGQNFGAGHVIGTLDFEQNAVFGPGDAITGSTTRTVQTMPLSGPPATTEAELDPGFSVPTTGSVAAAGSDLVHIAADGDNSSFNRLTGPNPNDATNWSPAAQLGPAADTRLAGGPAGTVLLEQTGEPGGTRLVARKLGAAGFGPAVGVSETGDPFQPDLYADPVSGAFFATWIDNRTPNELRFASSKDGTTWTKPQALIRGDEPDDAFNLQIAAGANGKGFVVYDRNSNNGALAAVPLEPLSSGTATTPNGGAGETAVQTVTVNGQQISLFAPKRCVKPGTKIRLRVTHRQKVKLSPKKRVKIVSVVFKLDKKKKTDKKAAFRKDFGTKGFKSGSLHAVSAKVTLKPVKGGKKKVKKLKGSFKIC